MNMPLLFLLIIAPPGNIAGLFLSSDMIIALPWHIVKYILHFIFYFLLLAIEKCFMLF